MRGRGLVLAVMVAVAASVVARERGWSKLDNARVPRADARRALEDGPRLRFAQADGSAKLPEAVANTVVRGLTPAGVEELLRAMKFEHKQVKSETAPTYAVAFGEYSGFLVLNDRVGDGNNHTALQCYAVFRPSQKPTLESINSWNRGKRFCRTWLEDQEHAAIALDLDLERGVTKGTVEQALWIFTASATRFAESLEPRG